MKTLNLGLPVLSLVLGGLILASFLLGGIGVGLGQIQAASNSPSCWEYDQSTNKWNQTDCQIRGDVVNNCLLLDRMFGICNGTDSPNVSAVSQQTTGTQCASRSGTWQDVFNRIFGLCSESTVSPSPIPTRVSSPTTFNPVVNGGAIATAKALTQEITNAVDCPWYYFNLCTPSLDKETLATLAQTHRDQVAGLIEQGCYADCLIENELILSNSDVNNLPEESRLISERSVTMQGTLAVLDYHDVRGNSGSLPCPYILTPSGGNSFGICYDGVTPASVTPGSRVEVSGIQFGNSILIPSARSNFVIQVRSPGNEVRPMVGTKKMAFIAVNYDDTASINNKVSEMKTWYARSSGGRLDMQITVTHASFSGQLPCHPQTFLDLFTAVGSPVDYHFLFYLVGGQGNYACGIMPDTESPYPDKPLVNYGGTSMPARQAFSPINLPIAAYIHETGHNMGLESIVDGQEHSSNPADIMQPYIQYYGTTAAELPDFSNNEKVALAWAGGQPPPPTPTPTPTFTPARTPTPTPIRTPTPTFTSTPTGTPVTTPTPTPTRTPILTPTPIRTPTPTPSVLPPPSGNEPSVQIQSPSFFSQVAQTFSVNATAVDHSGSGLKKIVIWLDIQPDGSGQFIARCDSNGQASSSCSGTVYTLPGDHTITVIVTDNAFNKGEGSVIVEVTDQVDQGGKCSLLQFWKCL